jgi:hypothetical protein
VSRARRNRLEEQAYVRDVLLALGGSPEEFDRAHEPSMDDASVGSRIAAYSRIAGGASVAETMVEEIRPAARVEVVRLEPARRPERRPRARPLRARGGQVRHLVVAVAHAPRVLLQGLVRAAIALVRALRGPAAVLVRVVLRAVRELRLVVTSATALLSRLLTRALDVVRLLARLLLRAAREVRSVALVVYRAAGELGLALPRATAALARPRRAARSEGGDETTHVAEAVLTWVQPRPEPSDEPPVTVEPVDVGRVELRQPADRSDRRQRTPAGGLAVVAAFAAAGLAAGVLALTGHDDVAAQIQAASAEAVGNPPAVSSRTTFSNPRKYAAAMTRLALASGRTQVDGSPACGQSSTFDRWTCRARGKPTLGAYAGVWLMYRCSPSSTPQPGGRAAVMINCSPEKPPAATA